MFADVLFAASVVAAVLPTAALAALVWWLDRYEREPAWLVALAFAWGALPAAGLALVVNSLGTAVLAGLSGEVAALGLAPVLLAPPVEEALKGAGVAAVAATSHFDGPTDGFVYGAAVGLGFAAAENLLYFTGAWQAGPHPLLALPGWLLVVVLRSLFSATMHAGTTALLGAALGWARFRGEAVLLALGAVGWVAAALLHASWNGLLAASGAAEEVGPALLAFALEPAGLAFLLALFQLSLWRESRVLRAELAAEAEAGTLPPEHVPVLASAAARARRPLLRDPAAQRAYVEAATLLAVRRQQLRHCRGRARALREADVHRLRARVRALLDGAGLSGSPPPPPPPPPGASGPSPSR